MKPVTLDVGSARLGGRNNAVEAYKLLQEALDTAQFPPSSRLPGERDLAAQLCVSRTTLRLVLKALADSGRIVAQPHRGWFVAKQTFEHDPNRLRGFSDAAAGHGMVPRSEVLTLQRRAAALDEAEALSSAPRAQVVELERVRSLDGVLISVDHTYLPADRVAGMENLDLNNVSLYETLQSRYGIVPTRCDYQLQAQLPSERIAHILKIEKTEPVLVGYQVTFDQHGQAVIAGWQVYRGDVYRFNASLVRSQA